MNREDHIWIALRLLGFYLVFKAIESALGAFSEVSLSFTLEDPVHRTRAMYHALNECIEVIVYGFLGRYLVLDGQRLVTWALRNQRAEPKRTPPESAT